MYIIFILVSVMAAIRLRGTGLSVVAVVNAVINLWSLGVGWNFKDDAAWPRNNYDQAVIFIASITTLIGVGLLIASFIVK